MAKIALVLFFALMLQGCGADAPAPSSASSAAYTLVSEQTDADGTRTVNIRIPRGTSEALIKSTAESVIADRKAKYPKLTVKSYFDADMNKPVAISRLENGGVRHEMGSIMDRGAQEKIPTH